MPKVDGGLLNCWRQIARKYCSIQERKKPCKNGMLGWRNGRNASTKGESDDQECGW